MVQQAIYRIAKQNERTDTGVRQTIGVQVHEIFSNKKWIVTATDKRVATTDTYKRLHTKNCNNSDKNDIATNTN